MKIKRRKWQHVDNVANIFLAKYNDRDTRVMRVCCNLKEKIRPAVLQDALEETVRLRPQFQVKLHRGMFWRYVEESNDRPRVSAENDRVCPRLYYQDDPKRPLYKVCYYNNRISIDIFHAIADGSGAMEFLNVLVVEYLRRIYPESVKNIRFHEGKTAEGLSENSFKANFEKDHKLPLVQENPKAAFHVQSRKLPFDQLQFFEAHMPLGVIRSRAKELGVSVSSYIGAALVMAFLEVMPIHKRKKPVTVSMPVNLRSYYDSDSVRNFFNNVNIRHEYTGKETFKGLCSDFQRQLLDETMPEKIKARMNYYQGFQVKWAVRAVPLLLKEPALGFLVGQNETRVSAVLSNMGFLKLPESIASHIESYSGYCSSENPFVVICSFKDVLTLGISYPYSDTGLMREFIGVFTEKGIPVRLYATEVVK